MERFYDLFLLAFFVLKNCYCKQCLNCVVSIALSVINQQCTFQGMNYVTLACDVSVFGLLFYWLDNKIPP